MFAESRLNQLKADDFARRFSLRSQNLMWFLGAGASASAGIPTATDMVWEFKQQLFISQKRLPPQAVSDLSNPVIRNQLQAHIDSLGQLPPQGSVDEYAALFEEVYPAEADRRAYLDSKLTGAKPSYGHIALATLMQGQCTRIVWTTNFDTLVADACAKVYDTTGALTTGTLDAQDPAIHAIQDARWPVEVKLHGDFRSRRLKNTADELRHQDARLRHVLVKSCQLFGLVVVGYSGRDESVMDTLKEAIALPNALPGGLFWLHRGDEGPLPPVSDLLNRAYEAQIDGGLVHIDNFDETLRDLLRLIKDLDTTVLESFASERRIWSGAPVPGGNRGWPVIRLNALPVVQAPSICRRVVCKIDGTSEVRKAVREAGVNVIAVRSRVGVLAFGSDSDVRAAFEPYSISDFDIHTLDLNQQRHDSMERGLLRASLAKALERQLSLQMIQRGRTTLLVPSDPTEQRWSGLKGIVGTLSGQARNDPNLRWREGIDIRLDWADGRLWLLVEPRTVFNVVTADNRFVASRISRERTVKRYNKQLNDLLEFWSQHLSREGEELSALEIGNGIDAVFRISSVTGFSRRTGA